MLVKTHKGEQQNGWSDENLTESIQRFQEPGERYSNIGAEGCSASAKAFNVISM